MFCGDKSFDESSEMFSVQDTTLKPSKTADGIGPTRFVFRFFFPRCNIFPKFDFNFRFEYSCLVNLKTLFKTQRMCGKICFEYAQIKIILSLVCNGEVNLRNRTRSQT